MITPDKLDILTFMTDLAKIGIEPHEQRNPVYKYMSVETAKIILEKLTVRFRAPSTFNDPFEFNLDCFDTSLTYKEFKSRFDASLRKDPTISSKRRKEMLKNTTINNYKKAHNDVMENERNLSMLFCTSEINNNILMWSHYANYHKGICLGIYMPSFLPKIDCLTLKVNYTDSIIPKRFYAPDQPEKNLALLYWIFTKASCWGYEKEVRSVITNEDNQLTVTEDKYCDIKLHKSYLKEIYFGLQTSQKDIDDLKEIIKQNGYEILIIKKMKKIKGHFALTAV